jgi:hypothetical protein
LSIVWSIFEPAMDNSTNKQKTHKTKTKTKTKNQKPKTKNQTRKLKIKSINRVLMPSFTDE